MHERWQEEDLMGSMSAANWQVKDGNATEFPKRWEEMIGWARDYGGNLEWARLIQDAEDPNHFISMASWTGEGMRAAMQQEEMKNLIEICADMCSGWSGGPGTEVVKL
jgi:hypothetical protein